MKKILIAQGELAKDTTIQLPERTNSITGDFVQQGICYVRGAVLRKNGSTSGLSFSRGSSSLVGTASGAYAIKIRETKGLIALYAVTP